MSAKKKYQQAYDLYKLSYNYSPYDDYSVIYRMGQCQIGAKNIDNAMQCFYHIINNCEDDSVKSKAQAYIELLNDNSEIMAKHYNHLVKFAGYSAVNHYNQHLLCFLKSAS
ncbi:type III secretion-associated chaperone [Escherichia coli]|nr:type III secretion-associated chaperone [Escherichia coli]